MTKESRKRERKKERKRERERKSKSKKKEERKVKISLEMITRVNQISKILHITNLVIWFILSIDSLKSENTLYTAT